MEKFEFDPTEEPIIGIASIDNENEIEIRQNRKYIFEQGAQFIDGKELEKTAEQIEIIAHANQMTNSLRANFGRDDFNIPMENIHIIKKEYWNQDSPAIFFPESRVVAFKERPIKIVFFEKVFHELFHFKSMNVLQSTLGKERKITHYETGLHIQSRKGNKKYFTNLNEAIDAEYTKKAVLEAFATLPVFRDEKERFDRLAGANKDSTVIGSNKKLFDGDVFWAEMGENNIITVDKFPRDTEREILGLLIDKIFKANQNKYKKREEVFLEFAQVNFGGGIKTIIKLIDSTFGRGTAREFLKYENQTDENGKPFNDVAGQPQFVKDLEPKTKKDSKNEKNG